MRATDIPFGGNPDLDDLLATALEVVGEDVLSDWEEEFIGSVYDQRKRIPHWEPSEKQNHVLERIKEKLIKRGHL